jgi:hypothetical protein
MFRNGEQYAAGGKARQCRCDFHPFRVTTERIMRVPSASILLSLAIVVCGSRAAEANWGPSFDVERAGWEARQVVVATEGERVDGHVTVLESWKGDLLRGQRLFIPSLAEFGRKESRAVSRGLFGPNPTVSFVTGDRMLLFLGDEAAGSSREAKERTFDVAVDGSARDSVVWIEHRRAFAFFQESNPGDALLLDHATMEGDLHAEFERVDGLHADLIHALAIEAPASRASALAPFTMSDSRFARDEAFAALGKCGSAAVPALEELLHDGRKLEIHDSVIELLGAIGGAEVYAELLGVVREGNVYWRRVAPQLNDGWWNDMDNPDLEVLRQNYMRLYAALSAMENMRPTPESVAIATEVRDFWRSLPQLQTIGVDQISKACDALIPRN